MKIVLISTDESPVAMGVKALSSNLLKKGFDTRVVIMASWRENFKGFHWPDLDKICADAGLIGISCMTHGVKKAVEVKNRLKGYTEAPLVVGGIHATLAPDSLLDDFALVCCGEGEDLLVALASRIKQGRDYLDIPGLWVKEREKIFKNQAQPLNNDLNDYPYPDYDLSRQYIFESSRLVPMEAGHIISDYFEVMGARGCPHRCTFCSNYKIKQDFPWRKLVRQYSIDYFIGHLKEVCKAYPVVRSFWLEDDTFFAKDYSEIQEFAQKYKGEINRPFCILVSPWTYNEDKVRLLVEAGMDRVIFGIQSGSEKTNQNIYERNVTNQKISEITRSLNKFKGLVPYYDFIGMNPFETSADLINTIKLVRGFPVPFFVFSNNLAFYPGTKLRERALSLGLDINKRNRHTDAKHGYAILKSEEIKHKILHLIFLLMAGKANRAKIGLIFRFMISDNAIGVYHSLDKRFAYLMNKFIALLSIVLIYSNWKEFLRKRLSRKQITLLKSLYYNLLMQK